jgi:hypothetical protein
MQARAVNRIAYVLGVSGLSAFWLLMLLAFACLLSLWLSACGGAAPAARSGDAGESALRYLPGGTLTEKVIHAAGDDFTLRLPQGWTEVVDEQNAPNLLLWIVAADYSRSISFTPIVADPALYASLRRDGLRAVAKVSVSLKKDRAGDSLQVLVPIESFRLKGKEFCAYEYSNDRGKTVVRIVLFDTGRQFVECAALPPGGSGAEARELFEVQQGVLASLALR